MDRSVALPRAPRPGNQFCALSVVPPRPPRQSVALRPTDALEQLGPENPEPPEAVRASRMAHPRISAPSAPPSRTPLASTPPHLPPPPASRRRTAVARSPPASPPAHRVP